ncbi:MAG: amidase [Chloroflexota bacterium]|nr:MAG: amidase [Chloroflexota bacterium]
MEGLLFRPANQLAALIQERRISAVHLLEAYLAQIERHNARLNAIVTLDEEGACRRAWEADDALAHGRCWGPLHGVPFTLKDHQDTAGLRSTMGGYPPFLDRVPEEDGAVAARLKGAGAILLGKTNAVFYPFGAFGQSNNPWDLSRCPGVSSSGAAAALAAGLTPLDVGTDTNGSVLLPAHNCGIFGLRPTQYRVPLTGLTTLGPAQPFRSFTVFGPMARSVTDVKLALNIIARPDGRDCHVPPVPWHELSPPALSELRIAWTPTFPGAQICGEIHAAIETLAAELEGLGARTERCWPPVDFARQAEINRHLMNQVMFNILCQPVYQGADSSDRPSLADYLQLLNERDRLIVTWERFFDDWDVLLCPVCGVTAQPRGDERTAVGDDAVGQEAVTLPLRLAAVTGNPSLVIPLGHDATGLPIGAQLIGARWQDERLLAIGARISEITGGYCQPPGF